MLPVEQLARSGRRSRRHRRRRRGAAAPRVIGTCWPKTRSKAAISSRTVTPVAGADVDDDAGRVDRGEHVVEPLDGAHVGPGEVPDVDVVADAGAVAGRVVGAGDREGVLLAAGGHHQLAEHVRGLLGVDAGLEVGVGADRVEVAQDDRAQVGRGRHVLEDLLHHPLGPGVRRRRARAGPPRSPRSRP